MKIVCPKCKHSFEEPASANISTLCPSCLADIPVPVLPKPHPLLILIAVLPLSLPIVMLVFYLKGPYRPMATLWSEWLWCVLCLGISLGLLKWAQATKPSVLVRSVVGLLLTFCFVGLPLAVWGARSIDWKALIPVPPIPPDSPIPEDQWRDFIGPQNRFQVEMPGVPSVKQQDVPGQAEQFAMHIVDLGTRTFVVSAVEIPKPPHHQHGQGPQIDERELRARFDGAREGILRNTPNAQLKSDDDINLKGIRGREFVLTIPKAGFMVVRLLVIDSRLYMLLAGGRDYSPHHPEVLRFFQSFRHMPPTIVAATTFKDLLCYLPFDEEGGDKTTDGSGKGYHVDTQGLDRVPGVRGRALKFDGKKYLKVPIPGPHDSRDKEWTWTGWFKMAVAQKSSILRMIAKDNGPRRPLDPSRWEDTCVLVDVEETQIKAGFAMRNWLYKRKIESATDRDKNDFPDTMIEKKPEVFASRFQNANDDRWHHFAYYVGRWLYVDGEECRDRPLKHGFITEEIRIGEGFIGLLDEICVFNRILEETEIRALAGRNPDYVEPPQPRKKKE